MDCREFRRNHPALLDNELPANQVHSAHLHMLECRGCANRDASIRRSLLVFRNIPSIKPSPHFASSLSRRLAEARLPEPSADRWITLPRAGVGLPLAGLLAIAAALVMMAAVMEERPQEASAYISLPPVLASAPDPMLSQLENPAIAASMSVGLPVWPAFLMAERASLQMAEAEFKFASYRGR